MSKIVGNLIATANARQRATNPADAEAVTIVCAALVLAMVALGMRIANLW